jgi:hypothetical protein
MSHETLFPLASVTDRAITGVFVWGWGTELMFQERNACPPARVRLRVGVGAARALGLGDGSNVAANGQYPRTPRGYLSSWSGIGVYRV